MNLIIPMAGMGTRMRPQTLITPKPLFKIAGKTIVERLIEETSSSVNRKIENIVFITGRFSQEVEEKLLYIAEKFNCKGKIVYQDDPLGTAHAVHCAGKFLCGPVIVAFADTLFFANIKIDDNSDNLIWVKEVDDPSAFGIVVLDKTGRINAFVEKPDKPLSNLAIIGIYYFKEGNILLNAIQHLLDNKIKKGNEYQLTDALELMRSEENSFGVSVVDEWMDCGNVPSTLETNKAVLSKNEFESKTKKSLYNTVFIEPVYVGENVVVTDSVIGPYVSIENNVNISGSLISNSIIKDNAVVENALFHYSCIGANAIVKGGNKKLDISDFSKICE